MAHSDSNTLKRSKYSCVPLLWYISNRGRREFKFYTPRSESESASNMASLHFCQECNNLLYPKADAQRRIIVYACRICQYSEIVENQLVYRNDLLTVTKYASVPVQDVPFSDASQREQVGVTTDLGADATLVYDLVN